MVDQCSNCFYGKNRTYGSNTVLECRVLPPGRPAGLTGAWPQVQATDWCGDYEPAVGTQIYLQGQASSADTALHLLLASTDPTGHPVVSLRSIQVTNRDRNTDVVVTVYDGNATTNPLVTCGCPSQGSREVDYSPGIRSTSGNNLYFACSDITTPGTYVSAQGMMLEA